MVYIISYLLLAVAWQLSVIIRLKGHGVYHDIGKRAYIVAAVAAICCIVYVMPFGSMDKAVAGIIRFWVVMVGAFTLLWLALMTANIYCSVVYGRHWLEERNRLLAAVIILPFGIAMVEPSLRRLHSTLSWQVESLFDTQMKKWSLACKNFSDLKQVRLRQIELENGSKVFIQCNPARMISTASKIDKKSIESRKCFLCPANRPAEQDIIAWHDYDVLVNPYPIFDPHLTIPCREHTPQRIKGRLSDMMDLARELDGWALFYNGPKCGASAPDHFHFQAVKRERLPILYGDCGWCRVERLTGSKSEIEEAFVELLPSLYMDSEDFTDLSAEPMMNLVCVWNSDIWELLVFPRKMYRPSLYGTEPGHFMISPGTIEMCGVLIAPRLEDYESITPAQVQQIYDEVTFN